MTTLAGLPWFWKLPVFSVHAHTTDVAISVFDQEELGLRGNIAFAANKGALKTARVIVMDMVGFACYTLGCQRYPGLPIIPSTNRGDFLAVVGDSEHLPLLEAFQKSTQAGLPPVLTLPVPLKGMLIPDTLRSDHAPFWYQGSWRSAIDGYGEFAYALLPPAERYTGNDKPFFTGAAQIVVNATTMLLEPRSPGNPASTSPGNSIRNCSRYQLWRVAGNGRPVAQSSGTDRNWHRR